MYLYQFKCYMEGSCTLWRRGGDGDNCMHLKMSRAWAASVHLLLFLTDRHQFLSWFPGAVWGSEMGNLWEKIVGIDTLCLFVCRGNLMKAPESKGSCRKSVSPNSLQSALRQDWIYFCQPRAYILTNTFLKNYRAGFSIPCLVSLCPIPHHPACSFFPIPIRNLLSEHWADFCCAGKENTEHSFTFSAAYKSLCCVFSISSLLIFPFSRKNINFLFPT